MTAPLEDHTEHPKATPQPGYLKCCSSLSFTYYKTDHVEQVNWQKADAFDPDTYAHVLPGVNGVVHTLGTLLENPQYKKALSEGNFGALVGGFVGGLTGGNPLEKGGPGGYESLNRDSGRGILLVPCTLAHLLQYSAQSLRDLCFIHPNRAKWWDAPAVCVCVSRGCVPTADICSVHRD